MITVNGQPLEDYLTQVEGAEPAATAADAATERGVQVDTAARILSGRPMGTRSPAHSHTKQRRLGRALARAWQDA